MNRHELPDPAEDIRQEIKGMIPETAILADQPSKNQATILKEDKNGTKAYGGDLLAGKISRLTGKMGIGIGWRFRLVYWSEPTKLLNDRKQGYLIPLKDITLTPGGILEERFYVEVTNEPLLSSGAAAIFIVPA
ncbi:unnamed protein product [Penicillium nalgiovense]|uniref:Uncharacterized protein n=1 Tax=Penicillium nalgiovense TaxID=60175 RepID=A0A9W4IMZ8_PENNA|nr:unnamed protein product [Penicillium nalgiovense]CAG7939281.1 unnamed protein product [Penicillium nalgiovense]CAG8007518.1 unnamed protein product [Penicillium nalgiovense]CAG8015703.1 unnamed protein product [Penicillium nalgiovense]CAG8029922.1 unnamed protein product [Penicillium nalgiovense]